MDQLIRFGTEGLKEARRVVSVSGAMTVLIATQRSPPDRVIFELEPFPARKMNLIAANLDCKRIRDRSPLFDEKTVPAAAKDDTDSWSELRDIKEI